MTASREWSVGTRHKPPNILIDKVDVKGIGEGSYGSVKVLAAEEEYLVG
jgi:hypothetical protein